MLQALLPLLMGSMGGGASAGMLAGAGGAGASGMMGGAMPWLAQGAAPMGATDMGSAMPWLDSGPTKQGMDGFGGQGSFLQQLMGSLGGNSGGSMGGMGGMDSMMGSGSKSKTLNNPAMSQVQQENSPYAHNGTGRSELDSLLSQLMRG